MATVDDVIALFVEAGLGAAGTNLLIGPRPKIDPALTTLSVTSTGGIGPEGTHNAGDLPGYVRPSVQVVARAAKAIDAETAAQAAWNKIFAVRNRLVNGTWWRQTTMTQSEPFPIDPDENDLVRFVFNFSCVKRPSSATS